MRRRPTLFLRLAVTASDGYTKTITYDQIATGNFATYDSTGAAKTPMSIPVVSPVYSANGATLDSATGPVELGIICSDSLVSDGSSRVKMLQKVEVIAAQQNANSVMPGAGFERPRARRSVSPLRRRRCRALSSPAGARCSATSGQLDMSRSN